MPSSTRALCHRTIPSYGLSVPETVRHEATISPAGVPQAADAERRK